MYLMFAVLTQVDVTDGTLGWLVFGCVITFLLSRRKGRTLATSLAWALFSGGVAYFFGGAAHTFLEKLTGANLQTSAGTFIVAASGSIWFPKVKKRMEDAIDES
jgi:hypothetical protein